MTPVGMSPRSELEHTPAISGDRLETIGGRLDPPVRLAKFEGDAAILFVEDGLSQWVAPARRRWTSGTVTCHSRPTTDRKSGRFANACAWRSLVRAA